MPESQSPRPGQIELRTLGAVDLKSRAGTELRAVLQQPKRLALLVYLTLANPGKLQRRDSLLGLFWPDLDQEHARAALRRALYFLRQACGEALLIGRGDEEIGADPARIWCDALAFEALIERGELGAGLTLYGGHLLEGFYVASAPEVETWLDRERARLRELAAGAAWRLASEQRDDSAAAILWARKGLALAPTGEDALRLFLSDLDQRGDRIGAIRLYEDFACRLRTDFAVEPSRPTVELMRELRRRATPDRAVVEPSAGDRPVVVVTPFSVRGDAAHAYLREG
ncbi:MAG: BTAD domain-containing putative transcriptional regulator, partial [Gemmatimonadota bacterium]